MAEGINSSRPTQQDFARLSALLSSEFLQCFAEYHSSTIARVRAEQGSVVTAHDHWVLSLHDRISRFSLDFDKELRMLGRSQAEFDEFVADVRRMGYLLNRFAEGRFVDPLIRLRARDAPYLRDLDPHGGGHGSEIPQSVMTASQGILHCMTWRGAPLFKSVFEYAIYPMLLHEVRPRTIIEFGSGMGTSAIWIAEECNAGGGADVISFDLIPPKVHHPRVQFIFGDCNCIESCCPADFLAGLAHPWIVFEDAHANTLGILRYMHPYLHPGDYFVVEDSGDKQAELVSFCAETTGQYQVDTKFTDFFGRNCTFAVDSVLVKTARSRHTPHTQGIPRSWGGIKLG